MSYITIQVLEGLERGRTFEQLRPPVTIGREEENSIRLNDERVSRFHAKLQEDAGRVILTDLDSTNGTRVNGRAVQMRVMRPGDQLAIGRCLLVFGSREEIIARAEKCSPPRRAADADPLGDRNRDDSDHDSAADVDGPSAACLLGDEGPPPAPPRGLTPIQRVQLSDLLDHAHDEIRRIVTAAEELPVMGQGLSDMRVAGRGWQRLLRLGMDLAEAMNQVSHPDPETNH